MSRTWLFLHNDDVLTPEQDAAFDSALKKRLGGLPVAYITGEKEFYGRTFFVTQDVLIPKPDTELLVEKAVAYAKALLSVGRDSGAGRVCEADVGSEAGRGANSGRQFRFADICTGSGCIAISVLSELAGDAFACVHADATDISEAALAVARKNAESLLGGAALRSLRFYEGDLCSPLMAAGADDKVGEFGECEAGACGGVSEGGTPNSAQIPKYDMVLSNPPYVPADVTDELLKDGRGEPRLALDGDTDSALSGDAAQVGTARAESRGFQAASRETGDGLAIIRRLIPQVKEILLPGGVFFMETGEYNAEKAAEYLSKCGFTDIVIHRDLAGQLRLVESYL